MFIGIIWTLGRWVPNIPNLGMIKTSPKGKRTSYKKYFTVEYSWGIKTPPTPYGCSYYIQIV